MFIYKNILNNIICSIFDTEIRRTYNYNGNQGLRI